MWWFLVLTACLGTEKRQTAAEEATLTAMADHYIEAVAARDALIEGDLELVKAKAAKMGEQIPIEGLPDDLRVAEAPFAAAMKRAAEAPDLAAAAIGLGEAVSACGACHLLTDVVPVIDDPPLPASGADISAAMSRHGWAAEKLWLGLVRPSSEDLVAALSVLDGEPLVPSGTPADSPLPAVATELELTVHELAGKIGRAEEAQIKGKHYGELLLTCAVCHVVIRDQRR